MTMFAHEASYRGPGLIDRLAALKIVVCGAGALGSHLADHLVRHGARQLTVIDDDRVEAHNIGTQLYDLGDVGAFKANQLRARCFRATGAEIEAVTKRLTAQNAAKLLRGAGLVVDVFDNSASRRLVTEHCLATGQPCLHLGMHTDYGEIRWNEAYRVPGDAPGGDVCDYPLARNLVVLTAALGCEVILGFVGDGTRRNLSLTLGDLAVNHEDPA